MIGLDTNVLVRYLTQDEPAQAVLASKLIERQLSANRPGIVGHIVLCEIGWVLSRAYGYSRAQIADALGALLSSRELQVESPDIAILALLDYRQGSADFSDYLLGRMHQQLGAQYTVTFDKRAAEVTQFKLLL